MHRNVTVDKKLSGRNHDSQFTTACSDTEAFRQIPTLFYEPYLCVSLNDADAEIMPSSTIV